MKTGPARGFTLLELVLITGLMSAMVVWTAWRSRDGADMALEGAQSIVWESLTMARSAAGARGREARFMVHIDLQSPRARRRYLQRIAVQVQGSSGWETIMVRDLPEGVAMMPRSPDSITGLLAPGVVWVRGDGTGLRSSALRAAAEITTALPGEPAERWACVGFSPIGTTGESGDLVLGCVRVQPPGGANEPLQFASPNQVRGATISAYGLIALIDQRTAF